MPRDTGPALDVLARVRLGSHERRAAIGVATLGTDDMGRKVLLIELGALPSDGRCYVSMAELMALHDEEAAGHA